MQLDGRKCWMRRIIKKLQFSQIYMADKKRKKFGLMERWKKVERIFASDPIKRSRCFYCLVFRPDIDAAIQLNLQRPGRCFLFDGLLSASLQNVQSRLWCVTDLEQFCHHHHFSVGRIAKVENLSSFNRRDALTTDIKEPIRLDCAYGYFHVSPVMEMRGKKHTHIGRCGERGDEDLPLEMFRDI